MAGLDDILKQLPIDDIASKLGVDRTTAQDTVASRLGAASSTGGGIDFGKLLPMLAPIIMNYVANRKNAGGSAASDDDLPDLGDVLGGLLGGGSGKGIDLGPRRRRRPYRASACWRTYCSPRFVPSTVPTG